MSSDVEHPMDSKKPPTAAAGDLTGDLKPRLPTSNKWTALPTEFLNKVQTVFANQFPIEAQNGKFLMEGRIYPDELVIRAGYLEEGRLRQVNFEASMDLPKRKVSEGEESESKTMDRLYACLDALGGVMEEYFELGEDEDIDIPPIWRAYEFEGNVIFMQFSTVNSSLEEEANRLLGLAAYDLVNEKTSEDALGNAEIDADLAFEIQRVLRARESDPDYDPRND